MQAACKQARYAARQHTAAASKHCSTFNAKHIQANQATAIHQNHAQFQPKMQDSLPLRIRPTACIRLGEPG
eukprot:3435573-Rhodomonas_salina.6